MKMRELLSDASEWTQKRSARNRHGESTTPWGSDAVCWSLRGALLRCYGGQMAAYSDAHERLISTLGTDDAIVDWNDAPDRTFADVKDLVTRLDI